MSKTDKKTIEVLLVGAELTGVPEKRLLKSRNWRPYVGGFCASLTYVLVLIAMNMVENVTYVQVFRQISLPCGVLAGIVFLKEKSTYMKWIGVSLILAGLIITVL